MHCASSFLSVTHFSEDVFNAAHLAFSLAAASSAHFLAAALSVVHCASSFLSVTHFAADVIALEQAASAAILASASTFSYAFLHASSPVFAALQGSESGVLSAMHFSFDVLNSAQAFAAFSAAQ